MFKKRAMRSSYKNLLMFENLLYWENPRTVFLDVTNHCNLKCRMCPQSLDDIQFEKGHMDWELFTHVTSQVGKIKALSLFASGEPLLAKYWDRMLNYCIENNIAESVGFSTNGLLLTKPRVKHITGKNIELSVSIDGGTQATYEHIRRGGRFETLKENLFFLRDCKRSQHTDRPVLNITFVAWKENIHELPLVIQLASTCGAKQVTLIHRIFYKKEEFDRHSLCNHRGLFDDYLERSLEAAQRAGITLIHTGSFSRVIAPTEGLKEIYFKERAPGAFNCRVVDEHIIIGFRGLVRACCFIDKLFIGNVQYDPLNAIWNGSHYRALRLSLYKGDYPDGCSNCSFLQILGQEERACLCPLNTGQVIPASPEIKQPYDIMLLNREFIHTLEAYKHKGITADQAVKRLFLLWEHDCNFFEIANNIAVLYAQKDDLSKARHWIQKAGEIMVHDRTVDSNAALLVQS